MLLQLLWLKYNNSCTNRFKLRGEPSPCDKKRGAKVKEMNGK